jgi:hypothetical protein
MTKGFHEDFERRQELKVSSNRAFGIVFTVVFLVIALWPLVNGEGPRLWALVVAGGFLLLAIAFPRYLAPLNRLWARFGVLLHKVVNPIILGLMFVLAITPVALIFRALGKDPLNRRFDPDAESYWIKREDVGPPPETMRNQF